jgi:hypothetical protein
VDCMGGEDGKDRWTHWFWVKFFWAEQPMKGTVQVCHLEFVQIEQ